MKSIYGCGVKDIEEFLLLHNEKKYRALQIIDWLYIKRVNSFDKMSNLSKELIIQYTKL